MKAEDVARRATDLMRDDLVSEAPVGPYLADQLLLLFGIRGWQKAGPGLFRTSALTGHSLTQIDVLSACLEVTPTIKPLEQNGNVDVTFGYFF